MRKFILAILITTPVVHAFGQADTGAAPARDTVWRSGGITSLNMTQVALRNWAAGGENSISGNVLVSLFANMKKGSWNWDSSLDMALGGTKTGDEEFRKTDDKIDLNTKAGYEILKNLYATFLLNFKTQFTEGFEYSDAGRTRISHFMTPGYFLVSAGLDWKPVEGLSLYISPVTLKTTIVYDPLLVDRYESAGEKFYGVDPGKNVRNEIGAYFAGSYIKKIMENIDLKTKVELFSNYSNEPQNLDVNWETILNFKVNKFISAIATAQLLYDNDVSVPKDDANAPPGPGAQFKETLGIGFAWNFAGYGVR